MDLSPREPLCGKGHFWTTINDMKTCRSTYIVGNRAADTVATQQANFA